MTKENKLLQVESIRLGMQRDKRLMPTYLELLTKGATVLGKGSVDSGRTETGVKQEPHTQVLGGRESAGQGRGDLKAHD